MKKKEVQFEVEGLPPTTNHALLQTRSGRRFPSKEYKEWKKKVAKLEPEEIEECEWYEVEVVYYFPIYYKNGNIRRKDHRNLNKYADDEFCKLLGLDDKQIKTGHDKKEDCKEGEERTVWTIRALG